MKKFIVVLIFLWSVGSLSGQVTLKVTALPPNTPKASGIFISGDFNNWETPGIELQSDDQGNYSTTIPEGKGTVAYKITRGNWEQAEGNVSGNYRKNREFNFIGKPQTITLQVESWEDKAPVPPQPLAENVQVLDSAFYIPQLDKTRRIWLYLPPDYEDSSKEYPVIYMQDGQNLFDTHTSYAGSWEVEKTLNHLFEEGNDYGVIVVGIDNGEQDRIDEYTPWTNEKYGGGKGDDYFSFIAETLKPYIDSKFRTRKEARYTALIGSSLGALISTYGAVKYPKVFSKIGALSPAYWINLKELTDYIENANSDLSSLRIYSLAGAQEEVDGYQESRFVSENIKTIDKVLKSKGLQKKNRKIQIDKDGEHNEAYWRREFGKVYLWLFKGLF